MLLFFSPLTFLSLNEVLKYWCLELNQIIPADLIEPGLSII